MTGKMKKEFEYLKIFIIYIQKYSSTKIQNIY